MLGVLALLLYCIERGKCLFLFILCQLYAIIEDFLYDFLFAGAVKQKMLIFGIFYRVDAIFGALDYVFVFLRFLIGD